MLQMFGTIGIIIMEILRLKKPKLSEEGPPVLPEFLQPIKEKKDKNLNKDEDIVTEDGVP